MIQFYINNKPVPRAIARHHLNEGLKTAPITYINSLLSRAAKGDPSAADFCADYGVSVAKI